MGLDAMLSFFWVAQDEKRVEKVARFFNARGDCMEEEFMDLAAFLEIFQINSFTVICL